MEISNYELSKICIAEIGFDPTLLWSYVSDGTKRNVDKILNDIINKNIGNTYAIEQEIVEQIKKIMNEPRKKRFAMVMAYKSYLNKLISGEIYQQLRREFGVSDIDETTQKHIEENFDRMYKTDPFAMLDGTYGNNSNQ
jgi:hypothetical protein